MSINPLASKIAAPYARALFEERKLRLRKEKE